MSLVDNPKNKAAIAVYNALPPNEVPGSTEDPDRWSRADAVATATGYKPPTVAGILRQLESDGLVQKLRPDSGAAVWRRLGPAVEHEPGGDSPNGAGPAEKPAKPRSGRGGTTGTGKRRSAGSGDSGRVAGRKESAARNATDPKRPAGPKREPVGDCAVCGKPVVKVGRQRQHAHPRTEAAADHKATTSALAGRRPMTGQCTVCGGAMTKNGRSWQHDTPLGGRAGAHRATSAQPRTGAHARAATQAESTYVGADLGELKARAVEHAERTGTTVADVVRAAVAAYVKPKRSKGKS